MYHICTKTMDEIKPEGSRSVEASGEDIIAPQMAAQMNVQAGNGDVSSATEPLLGTSHSSINSTDSLTYTRSGPSVGINSDSSYGESQYLDNSRSLTDADIWVPPSAKNEDILATFDEEEDAYGYGAEDDDESADGIKSGTSSSLNSSREVIDRGSRFKEQIELKEKAMGEVMSGKFKNLVSQLLETVGIVSLEKEGDSWVHIVSSLAWEAALLSKPDAAEGKAMDPARYVKVKCVATGSPNESKVVQGLVFKKHAAHKHMATTYTKPKLMLIQGTPGHSSGLSSLISVIAQKESMEEYGKTLLEHLEVYRPNVVLMEHSAPPQVLEAILKMGVTLAVDMKLHRLERIAHCTGSSIWSANNTQLQKLQQCDSFYFEKFLEEHCQLAKGGKKPHKTLMFLEGKFSGLGCTVLLKGARIEELKKIKCVVQCAVVMAYHFILETSFLIDKEVMLSTISVDGGTNKRDMIDIPISIKAHQESIQVDGGGQNSSAQSEAVQDVMDTLVPHAQKYMKPYLPSADMYTDTQAASPVSPTNDTPVLCNTTSNGCSNDEQLNDADNNSKTLLSSQEAVSDLRKNGSDSDDYNGKKDDINAVLDSESILVLMSTRNALRGTVCAQSHFSHIKFYKNYDVPLGKFLQDNLLNQSVTCNACGDLPEAHYYYYAHHNKQLTIRVKRIPGSPLPGEPEGKLWMWSRCGKCKPEKEGEKNRTKLLLISGAARGLSFGKFLELNFSNYSSFNRLSNCGHSLHKDFLYFFGLGGMVSMFRYSPVSKYTITVPPQKLEFNSPIKGDWLQKETESIYARARLLFTEIYGYLKKKELEYSGLTLDINGSKKEFIDIEKMLMVEQIEFEENIKNTCIKNGHSMRKHLFLNRLNWELFLEACIWNRRFDLLFSSGSTSAYTAAISKLAPEKPDVAHYSNRESEATFLALDTGPCQVVSDVIGHNKALETCTALKVQTETVPGPEEADIAMSITENSILASTQDLKDSREPVLDLLSSNESHPTENTPVYGDVLTKRKITVLEELGENSSDTGISFSGEAAVEPTSSFDISKGQWVWSPFSKVREECMKDLNKRVHLLNFLDSFRFGKLHSPKDLPTVSQVIREEGLRVHVCIDDYTVSDYEGEVSSVIACALAYMEDPPQVTEKDAKSNESISLIRAISAPYPLSSLSGTSLESDTIHTAPSMSFLQSHFSSSDAVGPVASSGTDHPEIRLGKGRYSVVCLYANEFRGLRELCCPSELDYIASLSRCRIWDPKGGKSKASFAKTLDDRFVIKVIKRTEFDSFMRFSSDYFKYMKQSFNSGNRTCLAKVVGIYQVTVRQPKTGKEIKHDLMVTEHLSFGRNHARQYDLKGALHGRYTANEDGPGDVLLDQNFVNDMTLSPLYFGQNAKRLLQRAVWNDTTFLNSINVMDYSLLVGVNLKEKELVCGIIDYLRQYTWDKQLETWVKSSLVVPKNLLPTIISPKEYKKRFRKFMDTHFLAVPDRWCSRRPSNPCKLCGIQDKHTSSD